MLFMFVMGFFVFYCRSPLSSVESSFEEGMDNGRPRRVSKPTLKGLEAHQLPSDSDT